VIGVHSGVPVSRQERSIALSSLFHARVATVNAINLWSRTMRAVMLVVLAALAGCASPPQRSAHEVSAENDRCASFSRENLQTHALNVVYRLHCVKDTPLGL
jgi:hypothetical protein